MFTNIVLSGGGIRGFAHIGVLRALEEFGINEEIVGFSGSSAGAIACMLYSIGYTANELYQIMNDFSYNNLRDLKLLSITKNYGFETGHKIEAFLAKLVADKLRIPDGTKLTFQEHYNITGKMLYVNTVKLNSSEVVYFSANSSNSHYSVVKAVRMSMAVPILIAPIREQGTCYVDGAILDSLPVSPFSEQMDDTLCISLTENLKCAENIDSFEQYLIACLATTYNELLRLRRQEAGVQNFKHHLVIDTGHNHSFNLEIEPNDRKQIWQTGYTLAYNYLAKIAKKTLSSTIIDESDSSK